MDASLYRIARNNKAPLRVGLLLESRVLPQWFVKACDDIVECNFASIELVVIDSRAGPLPTDKSDSLFLRSAYRGNLPARILLQIYQNWDRRNLEAGSDPRALVDCLERYKPAKVMHVSFIADGARNRLSYHDVELVCAEKLDVLLHFGLARPHDQIHDAARYGIWSYRHGNAGLGGVDIPYLRELLDDVPESTASLCVLAEAPEADLTICKGVFATQNGHSLARNCLQPLWGASTFVIQKLHELHTYNWEHIRQQATKIHSPSPIGCPRNELSTFKILRWLLLGSYRRLLAIAFRSKIASHWRIAYRRGNRLLSEDHAPINLESFIWLESPRGFAYADPFLAHVNGRTWVFFENYEYASNKGIICCAELREESLGEPTTVLERPFHLSYPCLFEDNGTWYMIPEAATSNSVDLYRCNCFPNDWQFERTLIKGSAVDSTLFKHCDTYWLYVTYIEPRGGACQLWLYFAPSLAGNWTSHHMNPVQTDVRYARGAGGIFEEDGRLFRPSQDGRGEYGRRLILNEILVINQNEYREEPRSQIEPTKGSEFVGLHTYNRVEGIECIDGKSRVPIHKVHSSKELNVASVFIRNALTSWTTLAYTAITGFFLSPFVVANLGTTQFGVWSLIAGLVGYLSLLDFGIRQAVNKYTASLRAKGDHQQSSKVVSAALKLFAIIGFAVIALAGLFAVLAPHIFNIPEALIGQARLVVLISGTAIAVTLVSGVFGGVITGVERFDVTSGIEILATTIRVLGTVFVLREDHGIVAISCVHLGVSVLSCTIYFFSAKRLYPQLDIRPLQDLRPQIRTILSFGIPLTALYALGSIIYLSDSLVIGALLPIESVAYFAIAGSLYMYAKQVPVSLAFLMTPRVSVLESTNSNSVGDVITSVARIATLLAGTIAVTFALRGETFISLWMGKEFGLVSGEVLRIFAFLLLLDGIRAVAVHSITGMGQQRTLIRGYILEASCNLCLSIVLVQQIGIAGAAIGTLVPSIFMALFYVPHQLSKAAGIPRPLYLRSTFFLPAISCVPFGVATAALEKYAQATRLDYFFLQMTLILPLVPIAAWFVCLGESEKKFLKSAAGRLVARFS